MRCTLIVTLTAVVILQLAAFMVGVMEHDFEHVCKAHKTRWYYVFPTKQLGCKVGDWLSEPIGETYSE